MRKALIILLLLCSAAGTAGAEQKKFSFSPGAVILGGALSVNVAQGFSESSFSFLEVKASPRFGQFITKDTLLFTFCNFQITVDFAHGAWQGGLDIGAQGRYFFTTGGSADFFIGLMAAFGLALVPDFSQLRERLLTGAAIGLFVPANEKVGFDFSLDPLFYIPLTSYQPFAIFISLNVGIVSAL